ncbi:hypothetical protein GPL15_14090 [Clostridium sp. MCC353]|uniref:DUF6442 family protein n=1 Tax=Clostridium sp. MCC353 TaxID=2592646 RepID=UPI001C00CA4E|nr:DUF6442 family protein [Clostridium sp. MCC353]MBT9777630.1 hypothetical protein [Clostridium sp. MCC353]
MNKDEILAKSRAEKRDEGMEQAENKGRRIGISAFCGVFIFIVVFNLFHGQSSYVPQAMFWAFIAAESYPKYRFTNSKTYLVSTVAGTIASAASLASYIIGVLR